MVPSVSAAGDLELGLMASVGVETEKGQIAYCLFDPLFFDEEMTEEQRRQDEEECRRREVEAEEEKNRKKEEHQRSREAHRAVLESIQEYNPKQKRTLFTRFFMKDFSRLDINEESPIPPMRNTHRQYETCMLLFSANILSVEIVSSDVGFPINVYGTVIVRDDLDRKCIHVFRRHRDDCQLIESKDDSLILTDPARGLLLSDFVYIEFNLKIKGDQGDSDRELSRGLLDINGRVVRRDTEVKVESTTLHSWLSTVQMKYAIVKDAVEATVEFKLIKGDFFGKIKARTTSIESEIVLYDTETSGAVICDGSGAAIKLQRRVISVSLDEMLVFEIKACDGASAAKRTVQFTTLINGEDKKEVYVGGNVFDVKVVWSLIDF